MNRTSIEWTDRTVNCVVGCPHGCDYCYARRQAKWFKHRCRLCYNFVVHPHLERLSQITPRQKPLKIFMDSMWDWNANGVLDEWILPQIAKMEECKQHTFQILSKRPKGYSRFTYPKNVWLGTSICDWRDQYRIIDLMENAPEKNIKFVSIEPILGPLNFYFTGHRGLHPCVDWVIIGAQTGKSRSKVVPERKWIDPIIENCRDVGVPIFIKKSIVDLFGSKYRIQEFPVER